MADIRLAKPAAGASESVQCAPDARFVFDFPTTDATLARDGDNLTISFEDGGKLQLEGFYQEYNGDNLPSFNIDGTEVAAADFFEAMNEPDLMPAAGPGTGTVANGARFHEWGDSALTGGIEHLNGLDWGFSRAFEWEDHPNAVGYHDDDEGGWRGAAVNHPVSITPENPGSVPPGTVVPPDGPENPTPPVPGTPGNQGIVPPGDVRLVSEAGLRDGDSVSVDGAMRVSAPDGLASIEVAGRAIWQNGHMVGKPEFHTDEGYFHNFAYDAATGRLTYTYTLTEATTEHKLPGADHIAHSLPLTVRDVDGDAASSNITIIIRDDVPEIAKPVLDAGEDAVYENGNVLGNIVQDTADTITLNLEGLTFGADHGDGKIVPEALSVEVAGQVFTFAVTTDEAGNYSFGPKMAGADGSAMVINGNGEDGYRLVFTRPRSDVQSMDAEGKPVAGASSDTYEFRITVKDADGDIATATQTIKTNEPPHFGTQTDPIEGNVVEIKVHESVLPDGSQHGSGEDGVSDTQTGTFSIDTHGAGGSIEFKWDGQTITYELSNTGEGKLTSGSNSISTDFATFTIDKISHGTVEYTFTLTTALKDTGTNPANPWDPVVKDPITMTLTDSRGNPPVEGTITVTVVDDAPVFTPESATPTEERTVEKSFLHFDFTTMQNADIIAGNTSYDYDENSYKFNGENLNVFRNGKVFDTRLEDSSWIIVNSSNADRAIGYITAKDGSFAIAPTFVHYQYAQEADGTLTVQNIVDLNKGIYNSGKSLSFTGEEGGGLSVGGGSAKPGNNYFNDAWNGGGEAGEISVGQGELTMTQPGQIAWNGGTEGPDKRYKLVNQYGGKEGDYDHISGVNVSEAVVFDLMGDVAFGFEAVLDKVASGDRVLLTFMLTPKNSDDDTIVKMVEYDPENKYIPVEEGFSKVIISSVPKGKDYDLSGEEHGLSDNGLWATSKNEGQEEGSGFTIAKVDFYKSFYVAHGTVEAHSADTVDDYTWDWTAIKDHWVHIKGTNGGDYKVIVDEENGTATLEGNGPLDGKKLFTASLEKVNGKWEWNVALNYEFTAPELDDSDKVAADPAEAFKILAHEPGTGDTASQVIQLNPTFNRFSEMLAGRSSDVTNVAKDLSDDRIGGKDGNSLIFGKGGDDILLGDRLTGSYDEDVDPDVQKVLDKLLKVEIGPALGVDTTKEGGPTDDETNDKFIEEVSGLSYTKKHDLGVQLEKLENTNEGGDDAIYGGVGNDFIFAGAGDDVILGYGQNYSEDTKDADIIYAGSGNDIIFYSDQTAYINGGTGLDVLVTTDKMRKILTDETDETTEKILSLNDLEKAEKVDNVEVLLSTNLTSVNSLGITSHDALAKYGIRIEQNAILLSAAWGVATTIESGLLQYTYEDGSLTLQIKAPVADDEGRYNYAIADGLPATEFDNDFVVTTGTTGADTLQGTATATDSPANDILYGGTGDDILYGDSKPAGVPEGDTAAVRQNPGEYAPADTDAGGNDSLYGGEGNDILYGGAGSDQLFGGAGDDVLYGGSGNDYLDGGEGKDSLFGGTGNDLIVYDADDYLVDGGAGIDFLLSDGTGTQYTLADMIGNWQNRNGEGHDDKMPMVNDVEVMIKGVDTSLQNMDALAAKYGFSVEGDKLILGDQWHKVEGNDKTTTYGNGDGVTLETTLTVDSTAGTDAGEQAAQNIVLSNG